MCLVRTNNIGGHLEQTQNKRVRPVELPDLTASSLLPPLSASMRNGSSFGLSSGVVYILRLLTMYGGIAKVHHSERVHLNCAMVFSDCLDMNHQCTHVSTALLERPVPPSHQPSLPPSSKAQPSSPFGGPAFLSLRRPSLPLPSEAQPLSQCHCFPRPPLSCWPRSLVLDTQLRLPNMDSFRATRCNGRIRGSDPMLGHRGTAARRKRNSGIASCAYPNGIVLIIAPRVLLCLGCSVGRAQSSLPGAVINSCNRSREVH